MRKVFTRATPGRFLVVHIVEITGFETVKLPLVLELTYVFDFRVTAVAVVATTTAAIATTTTSRAVREVAAATTTAVAKAEGVATGEDTAEVTPTVVVTRREAEVDGTSAEAGAGDEEGNG